MGSVSYSDGKETFAGRCFHPWVLARGLTAVDGDQHYQEAWQAEAKACTSLQFLDCERDWVLCPAVFLFTLAYDWAAKALLSKTFFYSWHQR